VGVLDEVVVTAPPGDPVIGTFGADVTASGAAACALKTTHATMPTIAMSTTAAPVTSQTLTAPFLRCDTGASGSIPIVSSEETGSKPFII
jgi:hypothetical protein